MRAPVLVFAMLALASTVHAAEPTPSDRATAVALFDEGRALMKDGKYAEACPKLEESQRIAPGMGILFNLSSCYEALGRTASAWVGYREVAAQARAAGQADREEDARKRAAALEPRLCRLTLLVAEPVAGLVVRRQGIVVDTPQWGLAVPVDPGAYEISAEAPGKQRWTRAIAVERDGATVEVEIPPLADVPATAPPPVAPPPVAPPPPVVPEPDAAKEPAPPALEDDEAAPRPWQRPLGIAAFAAGGAAVIAGSAVALAAKAKADDADCDERDLCGETGLTDRADAVAQGNVATGVFVAGSVIGAAGLVLWLTAPDEPGETALSVTPGALRLSGRW